MSYQRLNKFILPRNFRGRSAVTVQLCWVVQARKSFLNHFEIGRAAQSLIDVLEL